MKFSQKQQTKCQAHNLSLSCVNLQGGPLFCCPDCPPSAASLPIAQFRSKVAAQFLMHDHESWAILQKAVLSLYEEARDKAVQTLKLEEQKLLTLLRSPLLFSHFNKKSENTVLQVIRSRESPGREQEARLIAAAIAGSSPHGYIEEARHFQQVYQSIIRLVREDKLIPSQLCKGLNVAQMQKCMQAEKERLESQAVEVAISYMSKGVQLQEGYNILEAHDFFTKAIQLNPQLTEAYLRRGNCLYSLGQYFKALQDFNRVIEAEPQNSTAFYNKGNSLCRLKNFKEGIQNYERALAHSANKADVLINKGIAHKNMEQFDLAVQCYNRALQIKPNDHVALYNLANCLARMSKNLEALEKYDAAIRLAPDCEKYKQERNACQRSRHQNR